MTALKRGKIQEAILNELIEGIDIIYKINWDEAGEMVEEMLDKILVI